MKARTKMGKTLLLMLAASRTHVCATYMFPFTHRVAGFLYTHAVLWPSRRPSILIHRGANAFSFPIPFCRPKPTEKQSDKSVSCCLVCVKSQSTADRLSLVSLSISSTYNPIRQAFKYFVNQIHYHLNDQRFLFFSKQF